VKLMMWEVQCWTDETVTNTPDQIIPFVQRVVLGRDAELEGHKLMYNQQPENEGSDSEGGDEEDTEEKKDTPVTISPDAFSEEYINEAEEKAALEEENPSDTFEYRPISISLTWDSVDMIGNPSKTVTQKGQRFEELRIATCPMFGDAGFPPSPLTQGVAQMYATLVNSAKRPKQEEDYRLLASEPSQHIRTITVSSDKAERGMWILVDGRLYGSFARIRITPMVDLSSKDKERKQVFMPIKVFFPISPS